jgi:hypothetical protein
MTWPLIVFTLPTVVLGYFLGLLSLTFGMTKDVRFKEGVLQLTWRDWVASRWRYSTTLGACMFLYPDSGPSTEYHEFIHVRQYEDLNLLGAVIGGLCCIVSWKLGLILWATSGAIWLLPNFISGWIRFGDPYMGSEHERSAYAQTKCRPTS